MHRCVYNIPEYEFLLIKNATISVFSGCTHFFFFFGTQQQGTALSQVHTPSKDSVGFFFFFSFFTGLFFLTGGGGKAWFMLHASAPNNAHTRKKKKKQRFKIKWVSVPFSRRRLFDFSFVSPSTREFIFRFLQKDFFVSVIRIPVTCQTHTGDAT